MSQQDMDLLLWLHAEAVWNHHLAMLEIARTNSAWREIVDQWEQGHHQVVLPYTAELETEVDRLRREVEFEANGTPVVTCEAGRRDNLRYPLCACLTAEQAEQLRVVNESHRGGPQWSLPLCAVHPEADR